MSDVFFGTFLLNKGAVTKEQLQEAVMAQKQDRILLGQLAVNQGMMSDAQLKDVLQVQQLSGKKFGQLAREKGLLTEDQFQTILALQAGNHVLLGEALVRKGFLSAAELSRNLHEFEQGNRQSEKAFVEELARHPRGPMLKICLDLTRNYLERLGYGTKCVALSDTLPDEAERFVFYLEQSARQERQYLGIHLSRTGMRMLLGEDGSRMTRMQQHDEVSQLLFNLNYIICDDFRKQGYIYKHGAVQSHTPATPYHLSVHLESFIDNLDISYSFF